jgi:hypothetical protein
MISLWNCTYLFLKRKRNLKLKGYTGAQTSEWTRASGRPCMLLHLMRSAPPLALFFWETCASSSCCCTPTPPPPPAATCERGNTARVPQCKREREHNMCAPMREKPQLYEREGSQHACPNARERRERKHIACALMRETGREHSADAMCWAGACSTVRDHAWWCRCAWCSRACTRVRARGEQHLLQHTKTRWNN